MTCTPMPGRQGPTIPAPTALPMIPDAGPPFTPALSVVNWTGAGGAGGTLNQTAPLLTPVPFGSPATLNGGVWLLFVDLQVLTQLRALSFGPTTDQFSFSLDLYDAGNGVTVPGSDPTWVANFDSGLTTRQSRLDTISFTAFVSNANDVQFRLTRHNGPGVTLDFPNVGNVQVIGFFALKVH